MNIFMYDTKHDGGSGKNMARPYAAQPYRNKFTTLKPKKMDKHSWIVVFLLFRGYNADFSLSFTIYNFSSNLSCMSAR